jgi:hypothetical protein
VSGRIGEIQDEIAWLSGREEFLEGSRRLHCPVVAEPQAPIPILVVSMADRDLRE